jgi:hypothetical protein
MEIILLKWKKPESDRTGLSGLVVVVYSGGKLFSISTFLFSLLLFSTHSDV